MTFSPSKQHFMTLMASHSNPGRSHPSGPTEKFGIAGDHDTPRSHVKTESPKSARKSEKEASFMASDLFCQRMGTMINKQDVQSILDKQTETLRKFEKTNAKFGRFNDLSAARYLHLNQQLRNHTKMLLDMKKDLDSVFRRIRTLKTKLAKQYGPAFYATSAGIQKLEEELGASIENEDTASLSTLTESREFRSENQATEQGLAASNAEQEITQQKEEVINKDSNLSNENRTVPASNDNSSLSGVPSVHENLFVRTVDTDDVSKTVVPSDTSQRVDTGDMSCTGTSDELQTLDKHDMTETVQIHKTM